VEAAPLGRRRLGRWRPRPSRSCGRGPAAIDAGHARAHRRVEPPSRGGL